MNTKKEEGFTLIELLIVITIIAILSAVALPYFTKYKKTAEITSIQKLLTSCARELAVEYTENSQVLIKTCIFPQSDDNCSLVLTPSSGKVYLQTNSCILRVSNMRVKCFVTDAGKIKCNEIP